jgi:hypothetical protein
MRVDSNSKVPFTSALGVVQNIGLVDRVVRFIVGVLMIAIPSFLLLNGNAESMWYLYYSCLIAVYPLTTSVFGIDPLYWALSYRSCGGSERNQCGTFPYEVDAALGHNPIPDSEIEHSLELSHHK